MFSGKLYFLYFCGIFFAYTMLAGDDNININHRT